MIGKKINELRKKNNMSQEELANKLLVSSRTIIKWENGETEPSISNLNAIADTFCVTTDYLLGRDEEKNERKNKYSKFSIALSVVLVVFFICVIVALVFSTIELSNQISLVVNGTINNNSKNIAMGVDGIGPYFPSSKLTEMTIAFAKSQGVTITTDAADAATFATFQRYLTSLYTLKGDTFWYNGYAFIDYTPMVLMILLEVFILISFVFTIVLFVQTLRSRISKRKILYTLFAFTSLNLPAGFMLLVHNLATEEE